MPDPYISEVRYLGNAGSDFLEIAVDAGTDVSAFNVTVYHSDGTIRSENALLTLVGTEHGRDIYVLDTATSPTFTGLHREGAVSLSDGTTVHQFISFDDGTPVTASEGDANGMTSTQIGQTGRGESLETTNGGTSYGVQTSPNSGTIPCFLKGTLIETATGAIVVEDLKPGDPVRTVAGQLRKVVLCPHRRARAERDGPGEAYFPIRIEAGALGPGVPRRDLFLSRQHRVLVSSKIARRMFGTAQVLVAAGRLLDLPGVGIAWDRDAPDYHHLVLESHDVVIANGAPCESFLLTPLSLQTLDRMAQKRIAARFPDVGRRPQVPAVPVPPGHRQRRLVDRQIRNGQPLYA